MKTALFLFVSFFTFGQDTLVPKVTVPINGATIEHEIIHMCDFSVEAQFPGGTVAMQQYLQKNLVYPVCDEIELSSKAYVTFVVETNGELTNIEVFRAHCPEIKDMLIKLFENMPAWWPGSNVQGQIARTNVMMPIQICFL